MSFRRVALSAILLASALSAVACVPKIPFFGTTPQVNSAPPTSANQTPAPTVATPVATETAVTIVVNDPRGPYPEGEDAVLGTRHWGTRSSRVKGARGHAVTSDPHLEVETFESDLLAEQQADELLDLFEGSRGVRRIISNYGGDPDTATYFVKDIGADEDYAGNDTSWVTATLRAEFASPEGKRALELQVYRKKIDAVTLDLTPYVALTQISYLDPIGNLSTRAGYPDGYGPDELRTIRFKN